MKEIERPENKGTKNLIQIFRNVFDQCLKLDREGLDHGEINRPDKHIMINNKMEIKILDFESSSINRRVTNVTSIGHFLFIGGPLSSIICERFLIYDKHFLFQVVWKLITREKFFFPTHCSTSYSRSSVNP